MRGRLYYALIEVRYLAGTLPDDEREALRAAVQAAVPELSLTVAAQTHDIVEVAAAVRADNPLEAVAELNARLDQALLRTGLFEMFDVTGRALRVAPMEEATPIDDTGLPTT